MILYRAVDLFFEFLFLLILVRILLSWVRPDPYNPIVRFIYQVTDPVLEPFRRLTYRFFPPSPGMPFDFSPLIAIFVLKILRDIILRILLILF
ncbi:MAG: YggT family protein [Thermosediminibacterales bacterium]|nr:YggT family protein [Thermosediminibacterales bacterium]MDK2836082.1 YggT family protein [Thermosediminibacterales bacterium]